MIAFIDEQREVYGVEPICRLLPIAPSRRPTADCEAFGERGAITSISRGGAIRADGLFENNAMSVSAVRSVGTGSTTSKSTARGRSGVNFAAREATSRAARLSA